ncbi:uncharacterized protein LOC105157393 [Sesamum indicum]|uniref:Uncharacterized protein LOC105157393 n=1 Tax=Sesamum indicum TaxID=4182 RepID=A0A6I9SS78_SESIN|nr:uncharacterized protein LOC105157393 [Sesamum indicum]
MADIVKEILSKPIQCADEIIKSADQASSFPQDCLEIKPENSMGDVSWLLRVSTPADDRDDEYLGLPPIAANEPILCLIWEQIATLCSGSLEDRTDAAASLVSLARDNDRYGSLIIEEGGVPPLLKLAKEARMEGQEHATRAIGLLGRDPESVETIVNAGVCQVFAKILKEGHMKVQVVVAWAVSELAAHHRKCQDPFAQTNAIRLLVSHLAFETIQEHSKYTIPAKDSVSMLSVTMANPNSNKNKNGERWSRNKEDDRQFQSHIRSPMDNKTTIQMHDVVANTMAKNSSTLQTGTTEGQSQPQGNGANENKKTNNQTHQLQDNHRQHKRNHHKVNAFPGSSIKRREFEDPATKAQMKSMAARALRYLCAGNITICRSITESRALLCLAALLEKGTEDVKYNSAMALMEITGLADKDPDLRRSAFKPTAPAAKAVVDQFLRIIQREEQDLLIPSIRSIGNLARTFRATETRFIGPLVRLLEDREPEVIAETAKALNKFAGPDNFLHDTRCKSIIDAGGTKHLVPLVYFGEQMVQIPSFILLCYLAMHVPESETIAQDDVLIVLEWSTKQPNLMQDKDIETLVYESKKRVELYQSRVSKGYH